VEAGAWRPFPGGRWHELSPPGDGKPGFSLLPLEQTGVGFTNALDETASAANRVLLNGAGVATGDYDNDGLADIYLCSLNGSSALYKNLGNLRFTNVTESAGAGLKGRTTRGAVFADINGDGSLDLLVSTLADGVVCLMNDRLGKFSDVTASAGTGSKFGSVTMPG